MTSSPAALPVAVIGAGPIGLVAAAHLVSRGETPVVLEAGDVAGASILSWAHVRVFTPWKYLVDPVAERMLTARGWTRPPQDVLPTGGELVRHFVEPLASLPEIAPHVRFGSRVESVARVGIDKLKTRDREHQPFEVRGRDRAGRAFRILARAVIDASGTYEMPNPLGANGLAAEGEADVATHVFYGIPDVLGEYRSRYAGRRILVVGSGHSAFNTLLDLAQLAEQEPGTRIQWAIRRASPDKIYGGGDRDQLPARGALGQKLRRLVDHGVVELLAPFLLERIEPTPEGLVAHDALRRSAPVDEIVATTGFRPNLAMLSELRLQNDPTLDSPVALAPLIDPNMHSCGTVYPHGARELAHPEKDFYVVGMKSYGRAPTFLLLTGYEQTRSVVAAITGDHAAAAAVELQLPETGVCVTDDIAAEASCCGKADPVPEGACCTPEPVAVGAKPIPVGAIATKKSCC